MPVTAKPIIVPEKELDKFWLAKFESLSGIVGGGAWLNVTLVPYSEKQMATGEPIHLDPIDVVREAQKDPEAAQIYGRVMAYVQRKAVEQGKLEVAEVVKEPEPKEV